MFFETLGPLLARAGQVLDTDVRARVSDEFGLRQLDAVALIVSEIGFAWTGLFAALAEQNGILAEALAEADARLGSAPLRTESGADPLAVNRELLGEVATAIQLFHERDDSAGAALLRSRLREAAEVENRLLSQARAASPLGQVRRV